MLFCKHVRLSRVIKAYLQYLLTYLLTYILVHLLVVFITVTFHVDYLISLTHLCFITFVSLYTVLIDVLIYSSLHGCKSV